MKGCASAFTGLDPRRCGIAKKSIAGATEAVVFGYDALFELDKSCDNNPIDVIATLPNSTDRTLCRDG